MERRYSDYTYEELRQEVAELTEKARKAEQMGMVNEYAVHERKIIMAKSYMMNPEEFQSGETYEVEGDPAHTFHIQYMNGVFAWGFRQNKQGEKVTEEEEEALPISMLGKKV
ncbi:YfhH family protein [Halobacillus yeomjeoni]|uniref:YfhH family protein n=1 Tax=Halobacillus yeomjeoni TaxID=311194 RepID=A0A931HXB2_9BACI|nr:YfhH family protein [Halobacillus yeomjeoni]MBH0231114.1 YfhH family protein [Halobacillus yeomjeoni]MCA0984027.1 YfhH family protein [Halobacillus yeomjeoni]